jgi:hypothetical protein
MIGQQNRVLKLRVYWLIVDRRLISYSAPRLQLPDADPAAVIWKPHTVPLFDLRDHFLGRRWTEGAFRADRAESFHNLLPRVHLRQANARHQSRPKAVGCMPRFDPKPGSTAQ